MRREEEYSRSPHYVNYLSVQPELTWQRRAVVLDWMMLLASELNCRREAFANAVNLLDRYLGVRHGVPLDNLQSLAAVCLFIAEKLEDNQRIGVANFCAPFSQKLSRADFLQL